MNQSMMWAAAIPAFADAGVPCIEPLDPDETYKEDVGEEEAEELAGQAAQLVSAAFLYAAPTGGGGKLFLAIRDFTPGSLDPDPDEEARRVEAARSWAEGKLRTLAEILEAGDTAKVRSLLRVFSGEAKQQADYVVPGTDLAPRLTGLATQSQMWAQLLPGEADKVAYALGVAANGFAAE